MVNRWRKGEESIIRRLKGCSGSPRTELCVSSFGLSIDRIF